MTEKGIRVDYVRIGTPEITDRGRELEKRLKLETWMTALDAFKRRLRKCLKIVLASGIPLSVIRQAVLDILDSLDSKQPQPGDPR